MTTTESRQEQIKALCLFSGGLDSRLAVCALREQGVAVHAVAFDSPFFDAEKAIAGAGRLGVPLHVRDFTADIVGLVEKPTHGYGSCLNPCIDCHALMIRRAGEMMEDMGFCFICTGEVLNERPMSQTRKALQIVARESGYDGFVLRPLSARLLPETEPERRGWVDREKLFAIEGRSRKPQLQLAKRYELENFPSPAGGCRLSEPGFAARLRDLMKHEGIRGIRNIALLRVGRHFRLSKHVKLILGRDARENAVIEESAELYDLVMKVENVPGPTGLLPAVATEEQIRCAAAICVRYSDWQGEGAATVLIRSSGDSRHVQVVRASPEETEKLRVNAAFRK